MVFPWAALISAGANLLGAKISKPKPVPQISAAENRYSDVEGIFKAANDFKFSPFALLGTPAVGPSQQQFVTNPMGQAVADAGLLLADGLSKSKIAQLEEERLRLENEKLRGEVNRMILRPKVPVGKPSIGRDYGGRNAVDNSNSSNVSPSGAGGGGANSGRADGSSPLPVSLPVDPRREVDNLPIPTHSGFIVADSPWFGRIYTPTLDGEEPAGGELFGMALAIPQVINNKGHFISYGGGRESRPNMSREQGLDRQRQLRARWDKLADVRRLKKKTKNADVRLRHQELMAPLVRRQ